MNHSQLIGKVFQKYRITDYIKSGGMGSVYRAEHEIIQTPAVVKILHPQFMTDENVRLRFEQEAKILAKLQHPNIVRLLNYDKTDDGLIIVMDLVEGKTLADVLRENLNGMTLKQTNRILVPLLDALYYAHEKGVVHRDLKPNNIMVQPNGEPVLLDFGIAKFAEAEMTQYSQVMGTPVYMSPEQILDPRNIDYKSDIYTCGVLLFQLLSGTLPFDPNSSPFHIQQKIVQDPLPKLPNISEPINEIIQKATHKSKEQRFMSAKEMKDILLMEDATEPDLSTKVPRVTFAKAIFVDDDAENPLEADNVSMTGQEKLEQIEAERKAKEEAERVAKIEAERKAKEEAERVAKIEAERKAREEAERVAKIEAERKAKEEAERVAKIEAERKVKEEAERVAKIEAERKAKEEAERVAKIEAERRVANEEAERKAKIEAIEKAKEAERNAKIEAERKAKDETERQRQSETERRIREDHDRLLKTELEYKKKIAEQGDATTQIGTNPKAPAFAEQGTIIGERKAATATQQPQTVSSTVSEPNIAKKEGNTMRLAMGAGVILLLAIIGWFAFGRSEKEPTINNPITATEVKPPVEEPIKPVEPPPPPRDFEGEAFAVSQQTATIPAWKSFLEKYPKGKKKSEAQAALAAMNEELKKYLIDATQTEKGGLKDLAKGHLEKALKLDPTNQTIQKRLAKLQ
jgi:tRNA A-37 threonylcarbamoyl transferase component Bud32